MFIESYQEWFGGALFGGVVMSPPLLPFKSVPDMFKNAPVMNSIEYILKIVCSEFEHSCWRNNCWDGWTSQSTPSSWVTFIILFTDIITRFRAGVGKLIGAKNVAELDELYYNLTQSGKTSELIILWLYFQSIQFWWLCKFSCFRSDSFSRFSKHLRRCVCHCESCDGEGE